MINRKLSAMPILAVCLIAQAAAQTKYIVTDTGLNWTPLAINANSSMTGLGSNLSYVWSPATGLLRIPGLVYSYGYGVHAEDVNDNGTVVGTDGDAGQAVTWDRVNGTQAIGNFDGYDSEAFGINARGDVVGDYFSNAGPIPFLWKPGLGWTAFPVPGVTGTGLIVNVHDQVLCGLGNNQTAIWQPDGTVTYIGNMLTQTENLPAYINDLGYVCGGTFGPMGSIGYILDPAGNYTPIYNPVRQNYTTFANHINNHNVVVGGAARTGNGTQGFIWSAQAGFTFLDDVLAPGSTQWNIYNAFSITDAGQISATAYLNGQRHAVLLTPVHQLPPPWIVP